MPSMGAKQKYLGTQINPQKPFDFNNEHIMDKIISITSSWAANFLSQAGRVTLHKVTFKLFPPFYADLYPAKEVHV